MRGVVRRRPRKKSGRAVRPGVRAVAAAAATLAVANARALAALAAAALAAVARAAAAQAYNAVADSYHQTLQKKGQPLHEGFTIVKVRAARVADPAWWLLAFFGNP